MAKRSAIIFVCDRQRPDYLGPYGNTWVETPHLDELASQSRLVEFAVTDSTELARGYGGFWEGRHACVADGSGDNLLAQARSAGILTTLLTDEPTVAELPAAEEFDECILIAPAQTSSAAASAAETRLGQVTAAALEFLSTLTQPSLVWIHASGMNGPWDAPWQWRAELAGEDDPPPPAFVAPPHMRLDDPVDPDQLLGLSQAYAAQVRVLDECVSWLLPKINTLPESGGHPLFLLTSSRGYALGEHQFVGDDAPLYAEAINVPLFIRLPGGIASAARLPTLAQPQDVWATLVDWLQLRPEFSIDARGGRSLLRDDILRQLAVCVHDQSLVLRTPAWFWRTARSQDGVLPTELDELFVKPDDRHEVNNVRGLCENAAELLGQAAQSFLAAAAAGQLHQLPPLEDDLRTFF